MEDGLHGSDANQFPPEGDEQKLTIKGKFSNKRKHSSPDAKGKIDMSNLFMGNHDEEEFLHDPLVIGNDAFLDFDGTLPISGKSQKSSTKQDKNSKANLEIDNDTRKLGNFPHVKSESALVKNEFAYPGVPLSKSLSTSTIGGGTISAPLINGTMGNVSYNDVMNAQNSLARMKQYASNGMLIDVGNTPASFLTMSQHHGALLTANGNNPLQLHAHPRDFERRVGAYTIEERRQKIEKFRERKRQRIWRKQIKYDCRKRLADTRPR